MILFVQKETTNILKTIYSASLLAQMVKRLPAMRETRVWFLGREDILEKEMAIHSSTLAGKIPGMEEPDRLPSMESQSRTRLSDFTFTMALQTPLSMGFSRQEYWNRLPCPLPGDLPDPGIKAMPLNVSCIGRWVLYHQCHLRSLPGLRKWKWKWSRSVMSDSLRPHGL